MTLKTQAGILAPGLVSVCNDTLATVLTFASVRVSTCRWTPKGNLVVFTGPDMSRDQLSAASHLLTTAVATLLPDASAHISSCLNVHWGKVLINGAPTGILEGSPAAHSPSLCLQELLEHNSSLCPLKVTQLPSWVRPLYLFQPRSSSSLVIAFEDPDSTIAPSLIAARHFFCFGACIMVRHWRQPPLSKRPCAAVIRQVLAGALATTESSATPPAPAAAPPPPGPGPVVPGASGQKHVLSPQTPPSAKGASADRKSTRLNSSHVVTSRMPSSA